MQELADSLGVGPSVLYAVFALAVVQVTLDVWALVDLARRPADRVALGRKWVWVLVILVVSTFGAIVYLLVGRLPAQAAEQHAEPASADRAKAAVDALYGSGDGAESSTSDAGTAAPPSEAEPK